MWIPKNISTNKEHDNIKQVIVIRTDIKMGKGKMIAQACHASLEAYKKTHNMYRDIIKNWEHTGMEKVVLKVGNEKELLDVYEKLNKYVPCVMITDAGRTQILPGTITCIGIGPWYEKEIDQVTGKLKLL